VPKPKRLQDWYKKMLDKGVIERVVIDYKDIHKDAIENGMKTPLDIPYFEGDFWPNVLEECIKESEQEEEKRRKEEAELAMAAANEDFNTCGDDGIYDGSDGTGKDGGPGGANANGKKKNLQQQQKKKNIKNKMSQRKSVKKVGSSSQDLMTKILSTMEKHKEVFFVIRLLDAKQVQQMGAIYDKDPSISCDLMNGRDEFLNFARDKHHEFSSLRRAKYSSMALLYELHNQGNEKFVYTCNKCKSQMEFRFHCTVCEDFDLCPTCYESVGHEHKMEKLSSSQPNPDNGSGESKHSQQNSQNASDSKSNDPNKNAGQKPPKPHIEMYLNTFMHAVHCRNANCTYAKCMQFKRVVAHSRQCQKFKNSQCDFCRQLVALCIYHAKTCKDDHCQVPFCGNIKIKLKQQKAFNSQAERRRMLMMNKTLRQSANHGMMNNASSANPASPGDDTQANTPGGSQQVAGFSAGNIFSFFWLI
jgi:E1A/CREB-binding protein